MKNFLLLVLAASMCPVLAHSQNCSTAQMTLTGLITDIGTPGQCSVGPPFFTNIPITTTATYSDTCTTTANAASSPNTQYFSKSSAVTGNGQCQIFSATDHLTCAPLMTNQVTLATGPTDFNRFFNRSVDQTVVVSGDTLVCAQGGFHQDFQQCAGQACAPTPTPTPTPPPTCGRACLPDPCVGSATVGPTGDITSTGGGGGDSPDCSPIIIDTTGTGFHLTSAADGVLFDIRGDGNPVRLGWPAAGSGNAFLALPGSNGLVSDGTQLFGNFTPQPDSSTPNGFAALAVYDQPDHGGNGDGIIDSRDQIFSSLRLWTDDNHDGVCQPNELHRLPELAVMSISLQYSETGRTDQFGNFFRFKAKVNAGISGGSDVGPKAYDVFLTGK